MKKITHGIAAGIVALATFLCLPGVHSLLSPFLGNISDLQVALAAIGTVAALYHNPKAA